MKVQDVASAVLWFRGHSAFEGDALATHKVLSKKLRALKKKKTAPRVKPGSTAHKKRETEHEKLSVIVTLLASLKFHVYTAVLQDVLTSLSQLSLEGQQRNACAARIANVLHTVKEELRELQKKHGPYERWLRHNLVVRKEVKQAVLHGWVLDSKGVGGADVTKTILLTKLLQQLEERFQNEPYSQLQVADFRTWQTATVTQEEIDKVVASEKRWGLACPNLYGAHKHFGLAKKRYFDLPQADRSQMNGVDAFMTFWQALVAAESLPMPLRLYGAVVLLASPSSCDAERAISTLNRIVTPLRNRMSWPMVRLHLIGAEDVNPDGYPYELVAQSWGTTAHRRRRSSQNVRKPRKDKGKGRTRERVLPETAEYVDNMGQVSDSGSSLSSFGSISTDASSASALTVSDEESGTDSDSDSE